MINTNWAYEIDTSHNDVVIHSYTFDVLTSKSGEQEPTKAFNTVLHSLVALVKAQSISPDVCTYTGEQTVALHRFDCAVGELRYEIGKGLPL